MATLGDVTGIGRADGCYAVVSTLRADGTIQSSLVNAGVLPHPRDGGEVVGLVTYGRVKLSNLRSRPQVSLTFHAGARWVTVEGRAELIGPDDGGAGLTADEIRLLLREVFAAAGGAHDDWEAYDRVMAEQRRAAVLVRPLRVYSNASA